MSRWRKWTEEEDNILKSLVLNSENLGKTCEEAHRLLDRTTQACLARVQILKDKGFEYSVNKKYTREAEILRNEIMKSPDNIVRAFKRTSEQTNLDVKTLRDYYYNKKGSPLNRDNLGLCFMIVSDKVTLHNTKNTKDEGI